MSAGVTAAPQPVLRALLADVVDYAGLFPPASLEMPQAVANYAAYRAGADAWMLGRFVVPAAQLGELEAAIASLPAADRAVWNGARLSALLTGEFAAQAQLIETFNARAPHGVTIDVAEGRTASADAVLAMAASMPDGVTLYCELPHRDDPGALVQAVKAAGARAKIRTGGVTADAFPAPMEIVRFLRRCHEAGVTAKATAGLHHPVRAEYRLTYAPDAPRGVMYGYLNVFLCAAVIAAGGDDAAAAAVLEFKGTVTLNVVRSNDTKGTDPLNVAFAETEIQITRGDEVLLVLDQALLTRTRREALVAFGSCSFREPVDELAALGVGNTGTFTDD